MNNGTYTSAQEGREGQERAHATLFRADGNRYDGSVTQPRMGKNDLLNESIKSVMHQEWATPMPTELCAQATVDWRNPDASFNFLKLKIYESYKQ